MLSNKDLYKEIEQAEKVMNEEVDIAELTKILIKTNTLMLKLLHNIRVNMVLMMKHAGIEFPEKTRNTEKE